MDALRDHNSQLLYISSGAASSQLTLQLMLCTSVACCCVRAEHSVRCCGCAVLAAQIGQCADEDAATQRGILLEAAVQQLVRCPWPVLY